VKGEEGWEYHGMGWRRNKRKKRKGGRVKGEERIGKGIVFQTVYYFLPVTLVF